ncbi:nitrate- and nitrite sensing domain-containing protein [Nocardia amikacinitolerans]|uniref:sensor histidine kinase n=1 Tax=Nocardia amikacinitolerans TaxID=756689 RepID=UPI00367D1F9E
MLTATPESSEDDHRPERGRGLRARFGTSVRTRVLAIALIPSAVLFGTGVVGVSLVAVRAQEVKEWSDYRGTVIDPLLRFVTAVQTERLASMTAVDRSAAAAAELRAGRDDTDQAIAETARIAATAQDMDADTGAESIRALGELIGRMATIRESVDSHRATAGDIDRYYSDLIAAMLASGRASARFKSSDMTTMDAELTSIEVLRAAESHSRVVSLVSAGLARGPLTPADRRELGAAIGVYRGQFATIDDVLPDNVRAGVHVLISGADWRVATAGENEMAERGAMTTPDDEWAAAEKAVATRLNAIIRDQFRVTVDLTSAAADTMLWRLGAATAIMLLVTLAALAVSLILARRLVRRLQALRSAGLDLARHRLPAIIERIHQGEEVDVEAETAVVDRGRDEIGELAQAFSLAQRTAMATAAEEARTRDGFNKVFLDIAFRSQALVRRQLDILDVAEARQDDPENLELLFQLDHLATRARRNAENLLILGGRQPGRRWRNPVALEDIVRSAVSETESFARVSAVRLPAVSVTGNAVADVIHLLAELVDNATAFSSPDTTVSVHGSAVGKGVVVEIDDQGLGINAEDRARFNTLLEQPPQFHEMALAGHRHLGLFVVSRLAHRHQITVTLQESAYGGVRAIVLLPWAMLERGDEKTTAAMEPVPGRRSVQRPSEVAAPPALSTGRNSHATGFAPTGRPIAVDSRPALPRRDRLSHLSPELRVDSGVSAIDAIGPASPTRGRAPETVRSAMSALQWGTRRARNRSTNPHQ